jgi:hypothetical protein
MVVGARINLPTGDASKVQQRRIGRIDFLEVARNQRFVEKGVRIGANLSPEPLDRRPP